MEHHCTWQHKGLNLGLAVIVFLPRSGWINIRTVRLVCDDEAAAKWCNQKLTSRIYHHTESYWEVLNTFDIIQDEWCKEISTKVQWVNG
jgi:hypothetical protein